MASDAGPPVARSYVLGHSQHELDRLRQQAEFVDSMTARFLRAGGVTSGMRVLDVGCGAGHVAFLAAQLVGARGVVVGVDRSADAIAAATAEAKARSLTNVSFRVGDPADIAFDDLFDAVVGRYVLQFQPHPSATLAALAGLVRPGGVVIFHELAWVGPTSSPPCPTYDQSCRWAAETLRASGAETGMGLKLFTAFVAAGLPEPVVGCETLMAGGERAAGLLTQLTSLLETLAPAGSGLNPAQAINVGFDVLYHRMSEEACAQKAVLFGRLQVGCWTRTTAQRDI